MVGTINLDFKWNEESVSFRGVSKRVSFSLNSFHNLMKI